MSIVSDNSGNLELYAKMVDVDYFMTANFSISSLNHFYNHGPCWGSPNFQNTPKKACSFPEFKKTGENSKKLRVLHI